jgi:adenine-specific DNA-methyltransferase
MPDYRQKLKDLLYELFQFDSADLDFGFYAVMNQKRERIARFIEHDLLDAVNEGLQHIAQQSAVEAQQAFEQARWELQQQMPDLLQGDDIPAEALENPYIANSTAVRAYQAAKANRDAAVIAEDMEAQIYNDLYNFFARYYQDGDFISQRRYGHSHKYAIPYDGQEVHLHWANHDQYYVKTGVHFNNYSFTVPGGAGLEKGASVQVRLSKVDVPRDNLKGDRRFFIHAADQNVTWDEERQTLTIPMEYRPPTVEESKDLSGRNLQEALLEQAHAAILEAVPNTTLRARLLEADPQKRSEQDRLAYHLRRYAAANTRDFFVHKDLGGFLRREFDYYLKAEVLHLEDINFDDLLHARRAAARLRTTRAIGQKVIAFLDQLEGFQRRLFLKRKFILQSDYCLTLDKLPADRRGEFYAEILANPRQLAEWENLYGLTLTPQTDLNLHPRLMLDTAFFGAAFKARLLACFDDLEAATDGLLVHGENFQALNLLLPRYRGRVKCIYIDPPYNTGEDDFIYKDSYQRASWLAMLSNRIEMSTEMLQQDGVLMISCNDIEQHRLRAMLDMCIPSLNFMANLVWKSRQNVDSRSKDNISNDHEFVLAYGRALRGAEKDLDKYSNPDDDPRGDWMSDNMVGLATRARRPNLHFHILVGRPTKVEIVDNELLITLGGIESRVPITNVFGDMPKEDELTFVCLSYDKKRFLTAGSVPLPLDQRTVFETFYLCPDKGWRHDPISMAKRIVDNRILWPGAPNGRPRKKTFRDELQSEFTGFSSYVGFTRDGTTELTNLFSVDVPVSFPKPSYTISILVEQASEQDSLVVDYFAGSGTTAHAVMNLNREDGGKRKYVLVEMADYFDTVLKPRIQRVAYSDKWKDGRPVVNGQAQLFASAGQAHMFHYVRLESYDDVFHNVRFHAKSGPQLSFLEQLPDYFLSYKLEHESEGSPGLLDLRQFQRPFEYQLLVTGSDGVLEPQPVDLVATFNFLIGLAVHTVRHYAYQGQPYVRVCGATPDGQRACVLWRDVLPIARLDAERDWALAHVLSDVEYDRLYVNGENTLPGALLIEDEFKRRMFQGAR